MKVFLASLVLIGLGVFGMCFNIIFRKDGEFPEYEVGSNKEMRKMGIRCMKEEQAEIELGEKQEAATCKGKCDESCKGCSLYSPND